MDKTKVKKAMAPSIPNKLYFRIGEVSDLVDVKPYVLRYWESEFTDIKPTKSKSGQRLYKRRDVELLLKIKELLYEERFTINGARKRLKDFSRGESSVAAGHGGYEDTVEIEEGPKQLEVFAVKDTGDDEPVRGKGKDKQVLRHEPAQGRDSSKTLLKIRRDLEDILKMMHV